MFCGTGDGFPQSQQVIQIPLHFFYAAANASSADDHAHILGDLKGVHHFTQFCALITVDAARDTAGTGVVWHQYQITASQADKGRKCGTFVATLFFAHLNNDFLAFFDNILNGETALNIFGVFHKVFAGNFF